jgi:hypothetical protein
MKKSTRPRKSYALKHKEYLTLLTKIKNKKRRNKLIDLADGGEIQAIGECILNILQGTIPLSKRQLNQLKKNRNQMRALAKRSYSIKKKKAILKQRGGFLSAILPFAVSALSSLLPGLLPK